MDLWQRHKIPPLTAKLLLPNSSSYRGIVTVPLNIDLVR